MSACTLESNTSPLPAWRVRVGRQLGLSAAIMIALACSDGGPTEPGSGNGSPGAVAFVRFTPEVRSVALYDMITPTPTITDAAGRVITGKTVEWSSTDARVATVSETGEISAIGLGQSSIRATVDGKYGDLLVQVAPPPVAAVTLDATELALDEATTRQLEATPRDAQNRPIPGLGMTWHSSAPDIADVNALGVVTAVRPGTAHITVTAHGRTAEAVITVSANHPWDLVYQSFDGTTPTLWQLDIRDAGSVPQRLVPSMPGANPAISPDGSMIAFVSGSPDAGIWVANRDGSDARELVIGSRWSPVYQPAWSPDGKRIAYTRRPEGQPEQIWIVDVETRLTLVTTDSHEGGQHWPSWSPTKIDGSYRIAYAQSAGARQEIWTMRDDGTDARAVTTGAQRFDGQPAWSPDGQTIAFQRLTVSAFDIWLVDATGGNERALVGFNLAGEQSAPTWSPDGQLIAFASKHATYGQETSISQIYTIRANGAGLALRTTGDASKQLPKWVSRVP